MQAQDPTSSRRRAGARPPDRRRFPLGAGGLTAATLIGAAGGWSPPAQAALPAPARSSSSTQANGSGSWLATRRARALKLRIDRDEIEGIVLGELSAFSVMADVNATYNEGFDGFRSTSLDGTPTTI